MRRRTVLAAACGLALSACGWRSRPAQMPPRVRLRLSWAASEPLAGATRQSYAAVRPQVELVAVGPPEGGDPTKVDIFDLWSPSSVDRRWFQPLTKPLATLNADLSVLVPGLRDTYSQSEIPWAVPYGLTHLMVAVRRDAIDRWGLRADGASWDVAGVRDVCWAIRAAGGQPLEREGLLTPEVWTAFVTGFGGRLDPSGQPLMQVPGTVAGMQALAELVQLAGTPPQAWTRYDPTAPVTFMDSSTLANGQVANLHPPQVIAARFPRLPVQPVIPGVARALAVTNVCRNVMEAVRFMLWLVGREGQSLVGTEHLQSVRRDMIALPSPVPGVDDRGGLTADAAHVFVPDVRYRYQAQTRALLLHAAQDPAVLSQQASGSVTVGP